MGLAGGLRSWAPGAAAERVCVSPCSKASADTLGTRLQRGGEQADILAWVVCMGFQIHCRRTPGSAFSVVHNFPATSEGYLEIVLFSNSQFPFIPYVHVYSLWFAGWLT